MTSFRNDSQHVTSNYRGYGVRTVQTFQPRLSKPVIDNINRVLARHYDFTAEELDFIVSCDIKYHTGDELFDGDDD